MLEPRALVEKLERQPGVPQGGEERFAGYGVMGLTFTSGHILGLRRFPASSLGPSYTSIWHRDPEGRWGMYQDVSPDRACTRYFGSAVAEATVQAIDITWTGPNEFAVATAVSLTIIWRLSLVSGPVTRFMNSLGGMSPGPLWRQPRFLKLMGGIASLALGAGHLAVEGQAPNGRRFVANPRLMWKVGDSSATVAGQDLGPQGPLPAWTAPGEFWVPQRGLFVIGSALFETLDPQRNHSAEL